MWSFFFYFFFSVFISNDISKNSTIWDILFIYCFILLIPNSTYAFFEIKHIIFSNSISIMVFGGISLIGLACTLVGNLLIVDHYAKNIRETLVYYLFLSLICGFGASVGLLNYSSPIGFMPQFFPQIALEIYQHPVLIFLALGTSAIIFSVGYATHRFLFKPSS